MISSSTLHAKLDPGVEKKVGDWFPLVGSADKYVCTYVPTPDRGDAGMDVWMYFVAALVSYLATKRVGVDLASSWHM